MARVDNPVDLYIGTDANWWVGLILIGVAAVFIARAVLRPVRVVESSTPTTDSDESPKA